MVRRDGVAVRKERIQEITQIILRQLVKNNSVIKLSKIILYLQYEMGLTREKLTEYLDIAAGTEHFIIDEDKDEIRSMTFETDSG